MLRVDLGVQPHPGCVGTFANSAIADSVRAWMTRKLPTPTAIIVAQAAVRIQRSFELNIRPPLLLFRSGVRAVEFLELRGLEVDELTGHRHEHVDRLDVLLSLNRLTVYVRLDAVAVSDQHFGHVLIADRDVRPDHIDE